MFHCMYVCLVPAEVKGSTESPGSSKRAATALMTEPVSRPRVSLLQLSEGGDVRAGDTERW